MKKKINEQQRKKSEGRLLLALQGLGCGVLPRDITSGVYVNLCEKLNIASTNSQRKRLYSICKRLQVAGKRAIAAESGANSIREEISVRETAANIGVDARTGIAANTSVDRMLEKTAVEGRITVSKVVAESVTAVSGVVAERVTAARVGVAERETATGIGLVSRIFDSVGVAERETAAGLGLDNGITVSEVVAERETAASPDIDFVQSRRSHHLLDCTELDISIGELAGLKPSYTKSDEPVCDGNIVMVNLKFDSEEKAYVMEGNEMVFCDDRKAHPANHELGSFVIETKYMLNILELSLAKKGDYKRMLCSIFRWKYSALNNVCTIYFQSTKVHEGTYGRKIYSYGYCAHPCCRKYSFWGVETSRGLDVKVFANERHVTHSNFEIAPQLRGLDRRFTQRLLASQSCYKVLKSYKKTVPLAIAKAGKRLIFSNDVGRRAKSEVSSSFDRHKDPFVDLYYMMLEHQNGQIARVMAPFQIYLFSKEPFEVIREKKIETLHFDASGQMVATPEGISSKRNLVYALVAHIPESQVILPVAAMISTDHTAIAISQFLENVQDFYRRSFGSTKRMCKRIVVDVSYASVIGIARGLDCISGTIEYVNKAYGIITRGEGLEMTCIQFCRSHYTKIVVDDAAKREPGAQELYSNSLKAAMKIETMAEAEKWFTCLVWLFESRTQTTEVLNAERELLALNKHLISSDSAANFEKNLDKTAEAMKGAVTHIVSEENQDNASGINITFEKKTLCTDSLLDQEDQVKQERHSSGPQFKRSEFYIHFNNLYEDIKSSLSGMGKEYANINNYFDSRACPHLLKKHIAVMCFWTNMLGNRVCCTGKKTISNGPVESFFRLVKCDELHFTRYIRPSRFVRLYQGFVLAATNFAGLNPQKRHCSVKMMHKEKVQKQQGKRRKYRKDEGMVGIPENEHDVSENWFGYKNRDRENVRNPQRVGNKQVRVLEQKGTCSLLRSNGTVTDDSYYVTREEPSFRLQSSIVGYYESYVSTLACTRDIIAKNLEFQDLRILDLRDTYGWLSDHLIDLFLLILIARYGKKNSVSVVSVNAANAIFKGAHPKVQNIDQKGLWLMPNNLSGNHFVLAMADFSNGLFYWLNPIGNNSEAINQYVHIFNSFTGKTFQYAPKSFQEQTDSFNCGVLVVMYAEAFLRNKSLCDLGDPNAFRQTMKRMFLEMSDALQPICLYCTAAKSDKDQVECVTCRRIVCGRCSTRWSVSSQFKCELCALYLGNIIGTDIEVGFSQGKEVDVEML